MGTRSSASSAASRLCTRSCSILLAAHPDAYFQVFTNGQFITDKIAKKLRQVGNATTLISIEGREIVSDERRGKKEVFARDVARAGGVFAGEDSDRCGDERLPDEYRRPLHRVVAARVDRARRALLLVSYLPAGRAEDESAARAHAGAARTGAAVCSRDAREGADRDHRRYYDGEGKALCPMSNGISHHVNPRGDIEPCPIIQFATENIRDPRGVFATMRDSTFLKDFRELSAQHTAGVWCWSGRIW